MITTGTYTYYEVTIEERGEISMVEKDWVEKSGGGLESDI